MSSVSSHPRAQRGLALSLAAVVGAGMGSSVLPASALDRSASVGTEVREAAVGSIAWHPCPSDTLPTKECARLRVPRDYGDRKAGSWSMAIARIPATGPADRRIGSLLWDGGGPGGPSTQMLESIAPRVSPAVQERFDFVAFDPRGIGSSEPALAPCDAPWPELPLREAVRWRTAQRDSAAELRQANRRCRRDHAQLAPTMSTNNVVRDLDRLRRAVGDPKLTFWGTSYGTRIGYVYAYRHPGRVRAMVLDGNIDPTRGYSSLAAIGGKASDSAFRFIRRNYPRAYEPIVRQARSLADAPIRLTEGAWFGKHDWLNVAGSYLAFQDAWPQIPQLAVIVDIARGTGDRAVEARRLLLSWEEAPNSNEGGAFSMVNCLDYSKRLTSRQQTRLAVRNDRRHPWFGGPLTLEFAIGCVGLSGVAPDPVPLITTRWQRERVADVPVLLANATNDGSTPMTWAKRMQWAFHRPMIRYRSGQHVIWGAVRSRCVNRPIDRMFLTVTIPPHGRTCPFVPPADTAVAATGLGTHWLR
ncbi:MAG: alpha/beta fold hydrolase [Candidatus Nanopelagicales bacterium]